MARSIPADRFSQLVEAATRTFAARGYRSTQISDVADVLGVAKGTLYGYVESKEALFDAAVRFADGHVASPEPKALPLPTPPAGSTVAYIRDRLLLEVQELELSRALSRPKGARVEANEFERIVRDLFRRMSRNRCALKIVDRCAIDHPGLASVWFEQGRWGQVALLETYFKTRIAKGHLRIIPNVPIAARIVVETVALWAIHMPWDPSPRSYAADQVENMVVDMLVHAYGKEKTG